MSSSESGKKSLEELKALNRNPIQHPEEDPLVKELRLVEAWLAQIAGRLEELNRTLASKQSAEMLRPELAKIASALEKLSQPPAWTRSGRSDMSRPCKLEETGFRLAERQSVFYQDKLPHTLEQSGRKGEDAARWRSAS